MSKNKKRFNVNSGEYLQHRHNIQADFLKKFKYGPSMTFASDPQAAIANLEKVIEEIRALIKPIQQAGGAVKPADQQNLREMVFSNLLQKFDPFDKDQLMFIITAVIGDRIMEDVKADPWAGGAPEQLSGQ